MLFPAVKSLKKTGEYSFFESIYVSIGTLQGFSCEPAENIFGALISDSGSLVVSCIKSDVPFQNDEEYKLSLSECDGRVYAVVTAFSERGLARGLFTLKRMLLKNEFILGEITDYPSFKVRGYIEGFYGKPWEAHQRKEMLSLMALFGENTHYYAPKDDPYHRSKWRELYPEREAQELKELFLRAKSLYVDFYYCIAPGLSMRYTSEDNIRALENKTAQLFSMGIRNFGLLLDDIPQDLFYKEDKETFGNAMNAHSVLVSRYFSYLKALSPDCRLTVCPTSYHGKGTQKELTDFALNIPEGADVFFTGPDICSKELTSRDAEIFRVNTNHKPLYWDNFPVNDAEMFMEMHIAPLIGRESDLYKYSHGIISNCMEYFDCNKFALITAAAYTWAPEEYDSELAFSQAVEFMLPAGEREAFVLFSDHLRTSCLNDENSRIMGRYLSEAATLMWTGNFPEALSVITEYTEKVNNAVSVIKNGSSPVYTELKRWFKKFCLMSEIMNVALSCLKGESRKEELMCLMEQYNESATVLTAFCFREFVEGVLSDEN